MQLWSSTSSNKGSDAASPSCKTHKAVLGGSHKNWLNKLLALVFKIYVCSCVYYLWKYSCSYSLIVWIWSKKKNVYTNQVSLFRGFNDTQTCKMWMGVNESFYKTFHFWVWNSHIFLLCCGFTELCKVLTAIILREKKPVIF